MTWAIINPELTPPFLTRNGGSCDIWLSIISAMRRSESEPISAIASAILSAAIATGSAWKLPPEMTSFSAAKTSGLSETALASASSTSAAWRICVRQAPITCGWQRREYGSCTLLQLWCDCEIALSSVSRWRYNAAASICPRWPRTSWMRASNGRREPSAASVVNAPQTTAEANRSSASNRPRRAKAVEAWVPLSSASPSFAARVIGSSPT